MAVDEHPGLFRREEFPEAVESFVAGVLPVPESLCRSMGADPAELDSLIKSETGYGGQEIMTSLRDDWKGKIKAEYGLKDEI
jgi:hypothetical protein